MAITTRWLVRSDMDAVMAIEAATCSSPWTADHFEAEIRQRNCVALVAEEGCKVIGFAVYLLGQKTVHLLKLGADPVWNKSGVSTALLNKVKDKLGTKGRVAIRLRVPESNLAMHIFLRSQGFRATEVERNHFGSEDAYSFQFSLEESVVQHC